MPNAHLQSHHSRTLTVLHQNVQSIKNKIPGLEVFLSDLNKTHSITPEVLCFTETWMSESNHQTINLPGYVNLSSYFRTNQDGGGVSIFVRDHLNFVPIEINVPPVQLSFEYTAIKLRAHDITIVTIYRSNNPRSDIDIFFAQFDLLLQKTWKSRYLLVTGDFNINLLSTSADRTRFLTLIKLFNLRPSVKTSTRVTSKTSSCIDNILINFPIKNILNKETNIFSGIGDHKFAQVASFTIGSINEVKKVITRKFEDSKIELFKQRLSAADFSRGETASTSTNKMASFYDIFLGIFNEHFPFKITNVNLKQRKDWITPGIVKSCAKKRALFELTRLSTDQMVHEYYRNYNKILQKVIRSAKRLHTINHINKAPPNKKIKAVWDVIASFSKSKQRKYTEFKIRHQGVGSELSDPHKVAECFNTFFVEGTVATPQTGSHIVSPQPTLQNPHHVRLSVPTHPSLLTSFSQPILISHHTTSSSVHQYTPHSHSHLSYLWDSNFANHPASFILESTNATEIIKITNNFINKRSYGVDTVPILTYS
uniref:Endonuclease/exonuclease/phosphatase domain-containing protein n=1 Tax=Cacopsylla melanoneura TaxID=428564 RepID=A0A8D9BGS2_9HEMI